MSHKTSASHTEQQFIMVHSFIAPQNTPFDQGLAKLQLTRRDVRNVFLEFVGMMLFTIWGSSAPAGAAPWANGLVLAACIYLSDGILSDACF